MSKKQKLQRKREEDERIQKRYDALLMENDPEKHEEFALVSAQVMAILEEEAKRMAAGRKNDPESEDESEENNIIDIGQAKVEVNVIDKERSTLDAYDSVQDIAPDIPRANRPPPIHGGIQSIEPCFFKVIDPFKIIVKYGIDPKAMEFELMEFDDYEIAPASGWLNDAHRTAFHTFVKEEAEKMIDPVKPSTIREPQAGDKPLSSRPSALQMVNQMLLIGGHTSFSPRMLGRMAMRLRHKYRDFQTYKFIVEEDGVCRMQADYIDPYGHQTPHPEPIYMSAYGKPAPPDGWPNDVALESFEIWLKEQCDDMKFSDKSIRNNIPRTKRIIDEGRALYGINEPIDQLAEQLQDMTSIRTHNTVEDNKLAEDQRNADNVFTFAETKRRRISGVCGDIPATSNHSDIMPMDAEVEDSAIKLFHHFMDKKIKWLKKSPPVLEANPEPEEPFWNATIYDMAVAMQSMYRIHRTEVDDLHNKIELLKWQLENLLKAKKNGNDPDRQSESTNHNEPIHNDNEDRDEMMENIDNSSNDQDRESRHRDRQQPVNRPSNRGRIYVHRSSSREAYRRPIKRSTAIHLDGPMIGPYKATRKFSPARLRRTYHRTTNYYGSIIDPEPMWNNPHANLHNLIRTNFGSGPYNPNYTGGDYELIREGLLEEAKTSICPPADVEDFKAWGIHRWGNNTDSCLCCFARHYTRNCPIFPIASDRRLLFAIRETCTRCRTRHRNLRGEQDECPPPKKPYLTCKLGRRGGACEGLPIHHSMLCSNQDDDIATKRLLIELFEIEPDSDSDSTTAPPTRTRRRATTKATNDPAPRL